VISAEADRVEVLLYVNQFRKNVNIQGEKMDQNRVVLTMARTNAGWKVVAATAI
jgi:Mce-associated membrane protein